MCGNLYGILIRENNDIKSVFVKGNFLESQYADDTSIFLDCTTSFANGN